MSMFKCLRCGYEWIGRVEDPKECPECKSRDWDKINNKDGENDQKS